MINKEKVLKIISYVDEIQSDNVSNKAGSEKVIEECQYKGVKKTLYEFLKNLNHDELVDICSLMDCGRRCEADAIAHSSMDMYKRTRLEFVKEHKSDEHLAEYLVGKASVLNRYLKIAISCYNDEKIGF